MKPDERLLYLYLATNEHTALCGIYQTTRDEMAHDTGIETGRVAEILTVFESLGIAGFYDDEWVVIPNYMKHQNMNNPKVKAGVKHDLLTIPEDVIAYIETIHRVRATPTSTSTTTKRESPLYKNLCAKYGKAKVDEYVETVENYCAAKGKRYKDNVAAAANWMRRDGVEPLPGWGLKKSVAKLPACSCGGKLKEYEPGRAMCENRDSEWRLLNNLWVEVAE